MLARIDCQVPEESLGGPHLHLTQINQAGAAGSRMGALWGERNEKADCCFGAVSGWASGGV